MTNINSFSGTAATSSLYKDFQQRFKLLATEHPSLIINTLSNIFTMRLIGNKTHGDLAEVGIAEFINQFMDGFECKHVGKELYRAKEHEEDIVIVNKATGAEIPVSLKAYGDGPLQLSTDKDFQLFPKLKSYGRDIFDRSTIDSIFSSPSFSSLDTINVMPLIYREAAMQCNIMVFDFEKMKQETDRIVFVDAGQRYNKETQSVVDGKGRSHPIYMFVNEQGDYICEVRYGDAAANALQRGLWTHTLHALPYFNSLSNGWISYEHNLTLVKLYRLALNSTEVGHETACNILQQNIDNFIQEI